MDTQAQIRKLILKAKEKRNWTWKEYSERSGVSLTTLNNYALSHRKTSVDALQRMLAPIGYELTVRRIRDEGQ